ncbi:MAG: glycosyltransferase [Microthrixaceae bacterium]
MTVPDVVEPWPEPEQAPRSPWSVDVVVVAYGSRDLLPGCLRSARGLPVGQVVVVDHGTDGSADVAERDGAAALRDPSNPGFGAGCNHGARWGTAPAILFLNPDAEADPDAVREGLARLSADPSLSAVEGVVRNLADGAPERTGGGDVRAVHLWGRALGARRLLARPWARAFARRLPALADSVDRVPTGDREVDTLAGTALLVRREHFEAVGGFDERYFLYGEDLDLCRRLRARGGRLLQLGRDWAVHREAASSAGWWDREQRWWQGTLQYRRRWSAPPARVAADAAGFVMWVRLAVARPASAVRAFRALFGRPDPGISSTAAGVGSGQPAVRATTTNV